MFIKILDRAQIGKSYTALTYFFRASRYIIRAATFTIEIYAMVLMKVGGIKKTVHVSESGAEQSGTERGRCSAIFTGAATVEVGLLVKY